MIQIHTDTLKNGRIERESLTVVARCDCGQELYGSFSGSPCASIAEDREITVEPCDSCMSTQFDEGHQAGCDSAGDDYAQEMQDFITDLEDELEELESFTKPIEISELKVIRDLINAKKKAMGL